MIVLSSNNFSTLWLMVLRKLFDLGERVVPRGLATMEISPLSLRLTDIDANLLTIAERKLNYSFMVAEWFWMMSGSSDVESISFYNKEIAKKRAMIAKMNPCAVETVAQ